MKDLKLHNIELYYTFNEGKAVVVEQFNSTLGKMIQKHMTSNKITKYIEALQKLNNEYNIKYHSSIKLSLYTTSKQENAELVIQNLYGNIRDSRKQKF